MAKPDEQAIKVTVTSEYDAAINEWRASCSRPKLEALGINQMQALDRMNSLLKKHFDGEPFVAVVKTTLPKDLQARVDALQEDIELVNQLNARIEQHRVPLAKDLQRHGLQQRQAAEMVKLSPTWLGQAAKRADTDLTNATTRTRRTTRS